MSILFYTHEKDYRTYVVQLLVQNYIESENRDKNYFIDSELNNDHVCSKKLDESIPDIHLKLKSKLPEKNPDVDLKIFFDIIQQDTYTSSGELKHAVFSPLLRFRNLVQLFDTIKDPSNTMLQIILVQPLQEESQESSAEAFQSYKNKILNLAEETQYKIFNTMKNETSMYNSIITDVLFLLVAKSKDLHDYQHENISTDEYRKLKATFTNTTIRVISMDELIRMPISPELLRRILSVTE